MMILDKAGVSSTKTELFLSLISFDYMCRKTTCDKCNKATWAGCGKHVESALGGV